MKIPYIKETAELFNLRKMNMFVPDGQDQFAYGTHEDEGVKPLIKTMAENGMMCDLISFGLAVATFENAYLSEHGDDETFSERYDRDDALVQIFPLMHDSWMAQAEDGDTYFYDFVFGRLTEMQDAIDDGEYFLCEKCGSPVPEGEGYTHNNHSYCVDCVKKMLLK